ncbi:MAG: beta-lactamase family protein [Planctomycetota bacterium]|nr:beta-lactamase family protein [Planctomycetota bacterium]
MSKRTTLLLHLATVAATLVPAARGDDKSPDNSSINAGLRRFVDDKQVAGAVALVATPDKIIHLDAVGHADIAAAKPMRTDSIFWIASMTKPITGTSILMLQDEGKLSVDDLVAKHIPAFKNLKTADGKPARITIRHLLTHTSGLSDLPFASTRGLTKLEDLVPLIVARPVKFEPGSKWEYCQSAINTAGRIVEVASGLPFDTFLERRLFSPLGMKDTTFYPTAAQIERLATTYRRTPEGNLAPLERSLVNRAHPEVRDRFPAANGGLFSTASDYSRFCRMILGDGAFEGKRYLKPESVRLMTTLQTGDIKTGFTPGNGWGLGWCVVRSPQGVTAALSPGSFGHGGAFGTQAWIDPTAKRIYILMVQRADFPNSDASDVRRDFQAAAAALTVE